VERVFVTRSTQDGILPASGEFKGIAGWKPALRQRAKDFFISLRWPPQTTRSKTRVYALYYCCPIGKQENLDEVYSLPKVTHAGFET
jgi:hypothetical protein